MIFNIRVWVLAAVLCPTLAAAIEGQDCRYGDSGSMCWPGGWGDGPPPMPSAPGSPPTPPGIDLSRGWIPQAPAPTGVGFGGGPGASSSSMPIVRETSKDIRKKSGGAVAPVLRPQGPCYRPAPTTYPRVKPFPKGTQFYLALDPTSSVDANWWSFFKTVLLVAIDNANQYFGSQPATSLLGNTAADDGFDPPLYAFKVFDSTAEAKAAADADGGSSKLVVRIYDGYEAPTSGTIKGGRTAIWYPVGGGVVSRAEIMINFAEVDLVKQFATARKSPFADVVTRTFITNEWLHVVIPHELFDHMALTSEHITLGLPVDDDDSALVYEGQRYDSMRNRVFVPPVSFCDMVHGWAKR